jgi:hypothetical protein
MKDLPFTPDFLSEIVIPAEYVQLLIKEGICSPELGEYLPRRITVRPGFREFTEGEIVCAVSDDNTWHLPIRITKVVHKTFEEITEQEALADGFDDRKQVVDPEVGIPRFYEVGRHDFSPNGEVTLIWFELAF